MLAALFLELAERIRAASIPNIVYRTSKKNGLPMIEQAKFIEDYGAVVYFVITFVDILPPFSNKVVLIGYVAKANS